MTQYYHIYIDSLHLTNIIAGTQITFSWDSSTHESSVQESSISQNDYLMISTENKVYYNFLVLSKENHSLKLKKLFEIQKHIPYQITNENFSKITEENYYTICSQLFNDYKYNTTEIPEHPESELNAFEKVDFKIVQFRESCKDAGLIYSDQLITRFVASILTKPFLILTGLAGSGKTKLAQAFVKWIAQNTNQYCILSVGSDWTNREPLLGYSNALNPEEYIKPESGALDLILEAIKHPSLPFFLILDEMNLSHVERYFSDFLSVMESGDTIHLFSDLKEKSGVPAKLVLPKNLFIIGTVNIDETTNMFSPKVLDRANTIEFQITQDDMANFLNHANGLTMEKLEQKGVAMGQSFVDLASKQSFAKDSVAINKVLLQFFGELKKVGAEFGYRSATEILWLCNQLAVLDGNLSSDQKIDIAIMQKLLPKLHGSRKKICPILKILGSFCFSENMPDDTSILNDINFDEKNIRFPLTLEKISRMYKGAIDNGFTSFAEA